MDSFLTGTAILLAVLAIVGWQSGRRPMTRGELRRRLQALDDIRVGQDGAQGSGGAKRGVERRPLPRVSRRTLGRASGVAGVAIGLLVGLVWVDERYSASTNDTTPAGPSTPHVASGAREIPDATTARLEPVRLEIGVVGLQEVWPLLTPEVLAAPNVPLASEVPVAAEGRRRAYRLIGPAWAPISSRESSLVGRTGSPSAPASRSGPTSRVAAPAISFAMSGFIRTERWEPPISSLGARVGEHRVADCSDPEPRVSGSWRCRMWTAAFWPATASAARSPGSPDPRGRRHCMNVEPPARRTPDSDHLA